MDHPSPPRARHRRTNLTAGLQAPQAAVVLLGALAALALSVGVAESAEFKPTPPAPPAVDLNDAPHRSAAAAEKSAAAAARSAQNTSRSAAAAERSALAAERALTTNTWSAAIGSLALLSPYLVIWLNSRREKQKLDAKKNEIDDRARLMIKRNCDAIEAAVSRHKAKNLGMSDLWQDLSELSSLRNVLKVYLDSGTCSHDLMESLSKAFQINFATRDALIMRDPAETGGGEKPADPTRSDAVLTTCAERSQALRNKHGVARWDGSTPA